MPRRLSPRLALTLAVVAFSVALAAQLVRQQRGEAGPAAAPHAIRTPAPAAVAAPLRFHARAPVPDVRALPAKPSPRRMPRRARSVSTPEPAAEAPRSATPTARSPAVETPVVQQRSVATPQPPPAAVTPAPRPPAPTRTTPAKSFDDSGTPSSGTFDTDGP